MTETSPTFNLWSDPWIQVTSERGNLEEVSLAEALCDAPRLGSLHENSPLVAAGVHRLLAAIAQAIESPASLGHLGDLLDRCRFNDARIASFGAKFGHRFDLFSVDRPFLQSADIPTTPRPTDKLKTVAYLAPEIPAGTEITHWRHATRGRLLFCPRCCAGGLVAVPAFATSGGAGIKPSINGVPPLYVLPAGDSLFQALAFSLITPAYQPAIRSPQDQPWWEAGDVVPKGAELLQVGYLQSITFPARRMRLFPEVTPGVCARCGRMGRIFVERMVFEMGLSRPRESAPWFDPFAAYHIKAAGPVPVRPKQGKALWRDYAPLFLTRPTSGEGYQRPSVVEQVDMLVGEGYVDEDRILSFRCTGMRTDMKAKIFEWTEAILRVPSQMLKDPAAAADVTRDSQYAETMAGDLSAIFSEFFDPGRRGAHRSIRERMLGVFWAALEPEFRTFVLAVAEGDRLAREAWVKAIMRAGRTALDAAAGEVGDRGDDLARQSRAHTKLTMRLSLRRKEWLDEHEAA